MELYQLVSFLAVAEEGNMTRASSRLNLSQPAVSAQIKALEEECGFNLFTRSQKGVALTPEGVRLKEKAVIAVRAMEAVGAEVVNIRGAVFGGIKIGVNTDPGLLRLKNVCTGLANAYPGLSLTVQETMSWDAVNELQSRNIDLAFSYSWSNDDRISAEHLGRIELAVVAPESWRERLAGAGVKEFARYPWIWPSAHCPLSEPLMAVFEEAGFAPLKAVVADQEAAILKLVAEGVGLGVMPVPKVVEVGTAYGVFTAMKLRQRLTLHLLCLERRSGERNIALVREVIKQAWIDRKEADNTA